MVTVIPQTAAYKVAARKGYHAALLRSGVLSVEHRKKPKNDRADAFPSNADEDSPTSIAIAQAILDQIQTEVTLGDCPAGQISGSTLEQITRSFVEQTFAAMRTTKWSLDPEKGAAFRPEQYRHLAEPSALAKIHPPLLART
jgi:hypothetical protein